MPSRAVKHVVLIKFKDHMTDDQIKEVIDGYRALPGRIEAMKGFEWGTDVSVEGLSDGYTHCFVTTFENIDGRNAYLPHPAHQAYVEKLLPCVDRLLVLDYHPQEVILD